jgi:5-methylcytosine-specific restriction enzyme A
MGGPGSGRKRNPGPPKRHWRQWYNTARWETLRAAQLRDEPLCRMCAAQDLAVAATIVDHVIPHAGDWTRFCTGELQSLCAPCHDGAKQRGYRKDVDPVSGWPVDPAHPANRPYDPFARRFRSRYSTKE